MAPRSTNCNWLVRLFCVECGSEHTRYFDTSLSAELQLQQGQCDTCFQVQEQTMLALGMLQQRIGHKAWIRRYNAQPRYTYSHAYAWHTPTTYEEDYRDTVISEIIKQTC